MARATDEHGILLCHLRTSRRKARDVAIAELLSLLDDLGAVPLPGGPFGEQGGIFWVALPLDALGAAIPRLPRLGYTVAIDLAEPLAHPDRDSPANAVRWRGRWYQLRRIYEEEAPAAREGAVDRRTFLLATPDGVRRTRGYRGNSGPLSRRGLPVADARLLVNLLGGRPHGRFLDPFAGSGGIVIEALAAGWHALSMDCDPVLRFGLNELAAGHCIGDCRALPFAAGSLDGIATEPPYEPEGDEAVRAAVHESHRVLRAGGRLVVLCAAGQAPWLRTEAAGLGFEPFLDSPISRHGLPVAVLAWRKPV